MNIPTYSLIIHHVLHLGIITEVEDGEFAKEPLMNNESIPLEERERALEKWNFPREDVEEIQTLGHGKMGRVFKARAAGITRDEKSTLVAVKQFDGTGEDYKAEFDLEVEMFAQLNHDNVARLMGVNVDVTPYYIITEFSDEVIFHLSLFKFYFFNLVKIVSMSGILVA